ncbi:MAG: hypothetical protein RIA09_16310 [Hoeflea sp.]|jgi:hypothetical protein|uniref:FAD-dependent thymidylate synthase n=1 Tax=Hoeflea sp. TaxID=1940281 RepID=UPI0032EF11A1
MGINVKIVADSRSHYTVGDRLIPGVRLTTFQLRYPRFIHAELMTHRVFSRNASSSRAIPVTKMLREIIEDPAMPIHWGINEKGMQANKHLVGFKLWAVKKIWRLARYPAVGAAYLAHKIGLHKQIANRICEPWSHINVLVSSTEYANWYSLRAHKDAQPEIRALARKMKAAQDQSIPRRLMPGDWHLPFLSVFERGEMKIEQALKVSTARCARLSYLTFDQKPSTIDQDMALYERLVGSSPLHASPAEHQAKVDTLSPDGFYNVKTGKVWDFMDSWNHPELHGNFRGFIQHRKLLKGEFVRG